MGGYSDTGRRNTATPPSNMITNAITFASTGRSMKNLANMASPARIRIAAKEPACCFRWAAPSLRDARSGFHLPPRDRQLITRSRIAQPSPVSGPFTHGASRRRLIRVDYEDVVALLIIANSTVGNHQHLLRRPSGMRTRANNPGNSALSLFSKTARSAIVPVEALISLSAKSSTPCVRVAFFVVQAD